MALTRYTYILLRKHIWTTGSCTRCSQQSGRGCSQRIQKLAGLFQKPRGVLQHIQASIFHYNTIGLHAVSIEIWPSTDSMYFEHYLRVLAATPIIWKMAIICTATCTRGHCLQQLRPFLFSVQQETGSFEGYDYNVPKPRQACTWRIVGLQCMWLCQEAMGEIQSSCCGTCLPHTHLSSWGMRTIASTTSPLLQIWTLGMENTYMTDISCNNLE
jgi:hypothetical protein